MSQVIQFHATWCVPCKRVTPILQEIVDGADDIVLRRVDIDEHPDIAQDYGVQSVPTMVHRDQDGNEIARVVGAKPYGVLKSLLKI